MGKFTTLSGVPRFKVNKLHLLLTQPHSAVIINLSCKSEILGLVSARHTWNCKEILKSLCPIPRSSMNMSFVGSASKDDGSRFMGLELT